MYQEAVSHADTMVEELGNDFIPRVFENMGWFGRAVSKCGRFRVYGGRNLPAAYMALLGPANSGGGRWVGKGDTPLAAVTDVLATLVEDIGPYLDLLERV